MVKAMTVSVKAASMKAMKAKGMKAMKACKKDGAGTKKLTPKKKRADTGSEESDDADVDKFRDVLKSRKFNKIFDELPAQVRSAYTAADKGANKRGDQTAIINATIKRAADGKLVVNEAYNKNPIFNEILERDDKKYFDDNETGEFIVCLPVRGPFISNSILDHVHL